MLLPLPGCKAWARVEPAPRAESHSESLMTCSTGRRLNPQVNPGQAPEPDSESHFLAADDPFPGSDRDSEFSLVTVGLTPRRHGGVSRPASRSG